MRKRITHLLLCASLLSEPFPQGWAGSPVAGSSPAMFEIQALSEPLAAATVTGGIQNGTAHHAVVQNLDMDISQYSDRRIRDTFKWAVGLLEKELLEKQVPPKYIEKIFGFRRATLTLLAPVNISYGYEFILSALNTDKGKVFSIATKSSLGYFSESQVRILKSVGSHLLGHLRTLRYDDVAHWSVWYRNATDTTREVGNDYTLTNWRSASPAPHVLSIIEGLLNDVQFRSMVSNKIRVYSNGAFNLEVRQPVIVPGQDYEVFRFIVQNGYSLKIKRVSHYRTLQMLQGKEPFQNAADALTVLHQDSTWQSWYRTIQETMEPPALTKDSGFNPRPQSLGAAARIDPESEDWRSAQHYPERMSKGAHVEHVIMGKGTIINREGNKVTIKFQTGELTLAANDSRLRVLFSALKEEHDLLLTQKALLNAFSELKDGPAYEGVLLKELMIERGLHWQGEVGLQLNASAPFHLINFLKAQGLHVRGLIDGKNSREDLDDALQFTADSWARMNYPNVEGYTAYFDQQDASNLDFVFLPHVAGWKAFHGKTPTESAKKVLLPILRLVKVGGTVIRISKVSDHWGHPIAPDFKILGLTLKRSSVETYPDGKVLIEVFSKIKEVPYERGPLLVPYFYSKHPGGVSNPPQSVGAAARDSSEQFPIENAATTPTQDEIFNSFTFDFNKGISASPILMERLAKIKRLREENVEDWRAASVFPERMVVGATVRHGGLGKGVIVKRDGTTIKIKFPTDDQDMQVNDSSLQVLLPAEPIYDGIKLQPRPKAARQWLGRSALFEKLMMRVNEPENGTLRDKGLSDMEIVIARLIAWGHFSDPEIAQVLGRSKDTASSHVEKIRGKLSIVGERRLIAPRLYIAHWVSPGPRLVDEVLKCVTPLTKKLFFTIEAMSQGLTSYGGVAALVRQMNKEALTANMLSQRITLIDQMFSGVSLPEELSDVRMVASVLAGVWAATPPKLKVPVWKIHSTELHRSA